MTGVLQILFLIALAFGGGYLGFLLRRWELSGFELWVPFGLIISYAIHPLVAFVVASIMIIISWALFPYGLHHLVISTVTIGATFFIGAAYFPVTEANFLMTGILLWVLFQTVSNIFYVLTGYPLFKLIKYLALNFLFCWLIFSKIGWALLQWLK